MDHIYLFLADGLFGYGLQALVYFLAIFAFSKKTLDFKKLLISTFIFAIAAFAIRSIDSINFGVHTILIIIVYFVTSVFIFKTPIYNTILAVLITAFSVIVWEMVCFVVYSLIIGTDALNVIKSSNELRDKIYYALLGIPINFLLLAQMLITYKIIKNKDKKGSVNGATR